MDISSHNILTIEHKALRKSLMAHKKRTDPKWERSWFNKWEAIPESHSWSWRPDRRIRRPHEGNRISQGLRG
jgi:hypothetical protein